MQVTILFDGGTPCNIPAQGYGIGYGSFRINDGIIHRINHQRPMSANAAEIWTLYEACKLVSENWDLSEIHLNIVGDSKIALQRADQAVGNLPIKGKQAVKANSSSEFGRAWTAINGILPKFKSLTTQWKSRYNSVRVFGH